MKIGYPCISTSITRVTRSTFRLTSYSEHNLIEVAQNNLDHLEKILQYNAKKSLLFFRPSQDFVPFAFHAVCKFNWQKQFVDRFRKLGDYIKKNRIRISMHPDQFVLINSPKQHIVENSDRELEYHCSILALMSLDNSAKIQIQFSMCIFFKM